MEGLSIYQKAAKRAAQICGTQEALSRKIGRPAGTIAEWIEGRSVPDEISFLRMVDLIAASDPVMPWTPEELDREHQATRR